MESSEELYKKVRNFFSKNNTFTGINTFKKPLQIITLPIYNCNNIGFQVENNSSTNIVFNSCNSLCEISIPSHGVWLIEFDIIIECNEGLSIISQDYLELKSLNTVIKSYENIIQRTNNLKCTISYSFCHCTLNNDFEISLNMKICLLRRDRNVCVISQNKLKITRIS